MPKKSPWTKAKIKYKIYSTRKLHELEDAYTDPSEFIKKVDEDPYHVFINVLNKTFKQADEMALEYYPEKKDSADRCKWVVWSILKKNESEGDTCINANLLAKIIKDEYPEVYHHIVDVVKNEFIFHYDAISKKVALEWTWRNELKIAEAIKARIHHPVQTPMDWEKYSAVDGLDLTDEQVQVLRLACDKSILMLNGPAGTGKTSAMKALVQMLDHSGFSSTILAPTGIAAKRIAEASGHEACTIHKFLASQQTVGDFLIIDEMSMVGVGLLGMLLNVVPDGTKIVFICDEAQLASISCGNIVQDIIDSGIVPIVNLTKVFRYGKGGIATVATDVRMGKPLTADTSFDDYGFVPLSNDALNDVMTVYGGLRTQYAPEDIMVLSPFNVRQVGTFAINGAIQSQYNNNQSLISYKRQSTEISFCKEDRIINTENNYHMQGEYGDIAIMNGEMGVVKGYNDGLMEVEYESGKAYLENGDIFKQLLGYSISIHKSQGSQAKAVIVVIDKSHAFFLSRNLLYVALSRAQKKLILIGDLNTVNKALDVQEEKERETWLKELLTN